MRFILVCIGWMFLAGCHLGEKKETHQSGPLSQLSSFEVMTFFSPYDNLDEKPVLEMLVSSLKQVGRVEFIDKDKEYTHRENASVLLFSLGGDLQQQKGSIQVFSNVEVVANKSKMVCSIWEKDVNQNQNLPYPVEEDGKVFFKKDIEENVNSNKSEELLEHLITEFAKEYRLSNSENNVPIFYLWKDPIF